MMSVEIVEKEVKRFLSTDTPEVLAIRGAWGVGKTYAWKKYIKEAQEKKLIALNKYSYVSLFGINSLDILKSSLFEQITSKGFMGSEPNLETFILNAKSLLNNLGSKFSSLLGSAKYAKEITPFIKSLSYHFLNNSIICIDDLERKGNGLDVKDVMGLINSLKEEKSCKVVFILNDEAIEKEMKEDYKLFREKVIDIELQFDPTAEECADIALLKDDENFKNLKAFTTKLGINNIRIIKKIERLANEMIGLLSQYDQNVLYQALQSLTLFMWSRYAKGENVPDINHIKEFNIYSIYAKTHEETKGEKQKHWDSILMEYNYKGTDAFDLKVLNTVEVGFINEEDFINEAAFINQKYVEGNSLKKFDEAWKLFHNCFDNNEKEVLDKMYESVKQNLTYIGINNFDSTILFLREFGRNAEADNLVDLYFESNQDKENFLGIMETSYFSEIKDKKLIQGYNDLKATTIVTRTPKEVLNKLIVPKSGASSEDEEILSQITAEEYYEIFKSENGDHLPLWIYKCLEYKRYATLSENK
ncbi:P-loop NTPase fold protein, partial [Candidatus Latescibacterota bacterium]